MKTTDWFPNTISPVYPGLYEVNMNSWPWPALIEWTETGWSTDIKINEWRGLQEKTL
jgi:hypothetical protein